MAEKLNREREGLRLAKMFLEYCFNVSDMIAVDDPTEIIKILIPYGLKMCDLCGGAMCDTYCPVSRYIEDMNKYLEGGKTSFSVDLSAPKLPALPLLGAYPQSKNEETSDCIDCAAECCWAGTGKKAAKCKFFKSREECHVF